MTGMQHTYTVGRSSSLCLQGSWSRDSFHLMFPHQTRDVRDTGDAVEGISAPWPGEGRCYTQLPTGHGGQALYTAPQSTEKPAQPVECFQVHPVPSYLLLSEINAPPGRCGQAGGSHF